MAHANCCFVVNSHNHIAFQHASILCGAALDNLEVFAVQIETSFISFAARQFYFCFCCLIHLFLCKAIQFNFNSLAACLLVAVNKAPRVRKFFRNDFCVCARRKFAADIENATMAMGAMGEREREAHFQNAFELE